MHVTLDLYDPVMMEAAGKFLLELAEIRRDGQRVPDIKGDSLKTWAQIVADAKTDLNKATPAIDPDSTPFPTENGEADQQPAKRRPGRPKGSKNAVTVEAEPAPHLGRETTVFATTAPVTPPAAEAPAQVTHSVPETPIAAAKQYADAFGVTGLATLLRVRYKGQRAGQLSPEDATLFLKDVGTALELGVPYGEEDAR